MSGLELLPFVLVSWVIPVCLVEYGKEAITSPDTYFFSQNTAVDEIEKDIQVDECIGRSMSRRTVYEMNSFYRLD